MKRRLAKLFGYSTRQQPKLRLSVVVIAHNIPDQIARTLLSLSPHYQRQVRAGEYEIIVVDNGSDPPLDASSVSDFGGNIRFLRIDNAPASPARAINLGLAAAQGEVIGVMIDGARLVTPGLLHFAYQGAQLHDKAVVASVGWYLGFDFQAWSIRAGYDAERETALLESIEWPNDGYRLFEIAAPDESSIGVGLRGLTESNAIFMRRELWNEIGGVDERFDAPGGGYLNPDIYRRALEHPGAKLVVLLGEGTFHQVHGGVGTNAPIESFQERLDSWLEQYAEIRGVPHAHPVLQDWPIYLGILPPIALLHVARAAIDPRKFQALGPDFDQSLWALKPPIRPADPTLAALVDLAHGELRAGRDEAVAAIARLIRERAPDEPEPQRLLSIVGSWLDPRVGRGLEELPASRRARYHAVLGHAYRLLGEKELARSEYQTALGFDRNSSEAQSGLSSLGMPDQQP